MSLIGNLFRSSIGRKFLMAVSGLVLIGFVVGHLVGNLQIFSHPDRINGYSEFLQATGGLLWAVRLVLLAAVAVHIWAAVVLTLENSQARGTQRYGVNKWIRATFASRYMRLTGFVVLAFILYHLAHFTFGGVHREAFKETLERYTMASDYHVMGFPVVNAGAQVLDVYSMVFLGFSHPLVSLFYIIAVGLLSLHLLHGIDSMFQTFGWRNGTWAGALRKVAVLFCVLYFIGNLAIPGSILTGLAKPAPGTTAAQVAAQR